MRIEFGNVSEFLGELHADKDRILNKVVRVRVDEIPEQDEAITFTFGIWATAISGSGEERMLLECGVSTGSGERGEAEAERLREAITDECKELGLDVRPGKLELY